MHASETPVTLKDPEASSPWSCYDDKSYSELVDIEGTMLPFGQWKAIQPHVEWDDRRKLMKRHILYCKRFNASFETVFLTANWIDRFLCKKSGINHLQILGAVAFVLAMQVQLGTEKSPRVGDLHALYSYYYDEDDIPYIKAQILRMSSHRILLPTPFYFLRRIANVDQTSGDILHLAQYLAAGSVLDERFIGIRPSDIAAGSYLLSLLVMRRLRYDHDTSKLAWSVNHTKLTGHKEEDIKGVSCLILLNIRQKSVFDSLKTLAATIPGFQESATVMNRVKDGLALLEPLFIRSQDHTDGDW